MAASKDKAILFQTVKLEKGITHRPVAVFNTAVMAKTFAVLLKSAHKSGDAEGAAALDPGVVLDGDGKLREVTRWSVAVCRYNPQASIGDDDTEVTEG